MNAKYFLTGDSQKLLQDAIAQGEKRTGAEIVCAVATESGRYDRAESIVGVVGSLVALVLLNALAVAAPAGSGTWSDAGLSILWQCLAVGLGFVAGSLVASYWHGLRRLIASAREMREETERSAAFVFAVRRLACTKSGGGLLLYVSLFERRVVILADEGVMKATDQKFLDRLRDLAIARLKEGRNLETLADTIRAAADALGEKFPALKGDGNEVPNQLLIFHPRP